MATGSSSTASTYPEPKMTNQTPQNSISTDVSAPLIDNLLPEIIFEILLRLPIKSLLRCMCVSKSWRSLISKPEFVKAHLSRASMNPDYIHHRLLLQSFSGPDYAVKSCSLNTVLQEHYDIAVDLDYPLKASNSCEVKIYGLCNGLVCIGIGTERIVFLWNPSTRKSKRLPIVERVPGNKRIRYGFGYEKSTNDYKVVGLVPSVGLNVEVMMYSLKTNSWRSVVDFSKFLPPHGSGICVNGTLHWTTSRNFHDVIVTFDLAKETFGEVLPPDYGNGYLGLILDVVQLTLDVLSGCLCVVCDYDGTCGDVWVMKEYGIRESWTKLVAIPYVTLPPNFQYSEPLCIFKNGDVLLYVDTHLVHYHKKDGTFAYSVIHNCCSFSEAYPYIESLVSFDTDANNGV